MKNGAIGSLASEDNDGYTVCGYYGSDGIFIQKVDYRGHPVSLKTVKTALAFTTIIKSYDNGFIIAGGDSTLDFGYQGIGLIKTDEYGNINWQKTIDVTLTDRSLYVHTGRTGSIYITAHTNQDTTRLIKTDDVGEVVWTKDFSLRSTSQSGTIVNEFSDGNLILAGRDKLIRINTSGNILNEINLPVPNTTSTLTITQNDEIVLATRNKKLQRLDKFGNIIWNKDLDYVISNISCSADGGFIDIAPQGIISPGNRIQKRDINGDLVWSDTANSKQAFAVSLRFVAQAGDGGYIAAGTYFYSSIPHPNIGLNLPLFIKTGPTGDYTSVALVFPEKTVNANSDYDIEWLSSSVRNIDIDYSTDKGSSWREIVSFLPAEELKFTWTVPFHISENCLLRIMSPDNSTISDQSDSLFSIDPPYNQYDYTSVNEVKMWIANNGDGSHNPYTDGQGYFWPGGETATKGAVFEDGLVWGGKVSGEIRVGGSTYRHGLVPGNIQKNGFPADQEDIHFQVWKSKKDWELLPEGNEKDINQYNYNHWPYDIGAPWLDENSDGEYTPGIDRIKYYGDEILYYVSNDFDTSTTKFMYGSDPMGLEVQCLTFAKDSSNGLKDAVFKKYKLINKGADLITDMYLSYWTDDDMGDANDDYVGVDTVLNLGYTWNGINNDAIYGTPPPALGHMIIQGPAIQSNPDDSARFGDVWLKGFRNLPVTTFVLFIGGNAVYGDPDLGVYDGTLQMYNYMQGLAGNGSPFIDPNTSEPVVFVLSGDPVSGTGWYEGEGWPGGPPPGDIRFLISSGPFNLAPGDTQEIAIAIFMALGSDNVQSIAALRQKALVSAGLL